MYSMAIRYLWILGFGVMASSDGFSDLEILEGFGEGEGDSRDRLGSCSRWIDVECSTSDDDDDGSCIFRHHSPMSLDWMGFVDGSVPAASSMLEGNANRVLENEGVVCAIVNRGR